MRPVPSCRSMKVALPISRRPTTRPAMSTSTSLASVWPSGRPATNALIASAVCVRALRCGYGSRPESRSASTFATRWAVSSSTHHPPARMPRWPWPPHRPPAPVRSRGRVAGASAILWDGGRSVDFEQFYFYGALGHDYGHRIADALAQQREADGRFVRNLAVRCIGFRRADNLVVALLAILLDMHFASDDNMPSALGAFFIDERGAPQDILDFENPTLDHALFLLGIVVFGVVLTRSLLLRVVDSFCHVAPPYLELVELGLELALSVAG